MRALFLGFFARGGDGCCAAFDSHVEKEHGVAVSREQSNGFAHHKKREATQRHQAIGFFHPHGHPATKSPKAGGAGAGVRNTRAHPMTAFLQLKHTEKGFCFKESIGNH
jgi:hypothetical protein